MRHYLKGVVIGCLLLTVGAFAIALTHCAAFNSPAGKAIENYVIELAKVRCVNELDNFDYTEAAKLCNVTIDEATSLIRSKVVGMNKTAIRRGGYKKAYDE